MRILIVDDDATLRAIVKSKMANVGNAVIEAGDGASGWRILQSTTIDFALIDLGLPDMDGRTLISRVRNNPATSHLPIVVITGRNDREAIDAAFQIGANYFLTKPINWALFRHQITYVMRMAEAERQAQSAHLAAQAESRLKDTIIGRLNYVLRPMAANIASASVDLASVLDEIAPEDRLKEQVGHIRADALTLEKTLGDMANFATLLTQSIELNQRQLSLTSLLDGVMQSVENEWPSASFQIEPPEYPIGLHCDEQQLTRALSSLLENAFRFSPPDRPVRLSARQLDDGSLCFIIDDEGPGIAPEKLRRLLVPMAVIDQADRMTYDVSGLGLATVKYIAEAHGGKLTVQSAVGRGTTATIHLPAELIAKLEADAHAA